MSKARRQNNDDLVEKNDSGTVRGMAYAETQAHTSLGTFTANINTVPTNTMGTEILSITYTPKRVGNKILVEAKAYMCEESNTSDTGYVAVFRDSESSAFAAGTDPQRAYDNAQALSASQPHLQAAMTVSSLATITFKLRAGGDSGAMSLNKQIGFPGTPAAVFHMGDKLTSWLKITEIEA